MAEQKQDDQLEPTYSNSVRKRGVIPTTCRKWWTIGRGSERGSGISKLVARKDDDDVDLLYYSLKKHKKKSANNIQLVELLDVQPSRLWLYNTTTTYLQIGKAINMMSMENTVKFSTWMRRLSPLSWCLCAVEHCYTEAGSIINWLVGSHYSLSSLPPHERGFKRQTLCQWQGYEYCRDKVAQRTVKRILRGRDTCSHSKVKHCYREKRWLCWEVGMWATEEKVNLDVWNMFLCQ